MTAKGRAWGDAGRRSAPWKAEHFLHVDGIPCTYSVTTDGCIVHLPGRINAVLSVLKKTHSVIEPKIWRLTQFE